MLVAVWCVLPLVVAGAAFVLVHDTPLSLTHATRADMRRSIAALFPSLTVGPWATHGVGSFWLSSVASFLLF